MPASTAPPPADDEREDEGALRTLARSARRADADEPEVAEAPKRRGRPPAQAKQAAPAAAEAPAATPVAVEAEDEKPRRPRGRPRKVQPVETVDA